MATLFDIDERLVRIDFTVENLTSKLVQIISENFDGNNQNEFQINSIENSELSYFITDSEFENILVGIYYDGRFNITLIGRDSDSPYTLKIDLDESLVNKLPNALREKLEEKYFSNLHN